MALTCSSSLHNYEAFEFIDCSTINISYNARGIATVSLTVISTSSEMRGDYTFLRFGGIDFSLIIRDVQVSKIPGTRVNTFNLSMTGFGC